MNKRELYFLLKEKYNWNEGKINNLLEGITAIVETDGNLKEEIQELAKDIELLNKSYPVDYLIGWKEFLGTKIYLQYKPLVPRPETEYWVELAINTIKSENKKILTNINVLDIFCGSGCIGISIIKKIKNVTVTFSDISGNALKQTRYNLKQNNIIKGFNVIKSDVFKHLPKQKFDYIFANPPYVAIRAEVGKEIFHEPSKAIWGGDDGLKIIRTFLTNLKDFCHPKTKIFMEFGEDQNEDIKNILENYGYVFEFHKDQFGKWRYISIKLNTF
jgi:release factor glutamine methyltransferase